MIKEDTEGKRYFDKSCKDIQNTTSSFYYYKVIRNMLQFENFKVDYKIRVDLEILWSLWVSISPKFVFLALPTICGKIDSSLMLSIDFLEFLKGDSF